MAAACLPITLPHLVYSKAHRVSGRQCAIATTASATVVDAVRVLVVEAMASFRKRSEAEGSQQHHRRCSDAFYLLSTCRVVYGAGRGVVAAVPYHPRLLQRRRGGHWRRRQEQKLQQSKSSTEGRKTAVVASAAATAAPTIGVSNMGMG